MSFKDPYYLFNAKPSHVQFVHKTIPVANDRFIYFYVEKDTVLHKVVMKTNAVDPQPYEIMNTTAYDVAFGLMLDSGWMANAYDSGFMDKEILLKSGTYLKLCLHADYSNSDTVGADVYYTGALKLISDSGA